jgi:hypothetical protein
MNLLPNEQAGRDLSPQLVSILTTEHYNLQNGRASTISDASGRANLFISAVSTTLIALAFIGQASSFGTAFFVFSLALFPTLYFLGIVTFERTLQSTIEDILYTRGMSRLRHLFLEYAPETKPYFILSASDDTAATLERMGMVVTSWQILLGTPGTIAVITSVIGGTFVGPSISLSNFLPLHFKMYRPDAKGTRRRNGSITANDLSTKNQLVLLARKPGQQTNHDGGRNEMHHDHRPENVQVHARNGEHSDREHERTEK